MILGIKSLPVKNVITIKLIYCLRSLRLNEMSDKYKLKPPKDLSRTPEELYRLMELVQWEFTQANRELRKLEVEKTVAEAKTSIIISARRPDLLTNERLKAHFIACLEDPKFKVTLDLMERFIYLEHEPLMEKYKYYESIAKQAEKEHAMLSANMMYHQSKNKVKSAELLSLSR